MKDYHFIIYKNFLIIVDIAHRTKNQLIIKEGIDNETTACYYDADTKAVDDLLK